jgi:putative phage-type endonuclease
MEAKLKDYISNRVHPDIKQRTDEWCEVKQFTVGGSQVAVLEGFNPYETERDLIAHKVGLEDKKAKGGMFEIAVNWGNVFEDVLRKYAEMIYKCKVVADDAFILDTECTAMSYSPDGLGVVADPGTNERFIALFEFKCPWSRKVGGSIPKYYKSQVLMGLSIIDVADKGIYLEAAFRLCRADQFDDTTSHITLPKQSVVKTDLEECLLKGVFRVDNAIVAAESRDLALLPPEDVVRLINDAVAGICHFEHVDQIPEDSLYLCWKLLDYNVVYVDPVVGYLDSLRPKAQEVINVIKKYKTMEKTEVLECLNAKYGRVGFSDEGM